MTKERLMVLAEETGVSKESMSGDGGFYDGWSGMKQLLVSALIIICSQTTMYSHTYLSWHLFAGRGSSFSSTRERSSI